MIPGLIGAHVLFYSANADADRAFFRDVLDLHAVDAGRGWLIFAMPPAEAAFHPKDEAGSGASAGLTTELYLMCSDVRSFVRTLEAKQVKCAAIEDAPWGIRTRMRLPGGGEIGLYQPKHPTAF